MNPPYGLAPTAQQGKISVTLAYDADLSMWRAVGARYHADLRSGDHPVAHAGGPAGVAQHGLVGVEAAFDRVTGALVELRIDALRADEASETLRRLGAAIDAESLLIDANEPSPAPLITRLEADAIAAWSRLAIALDDVEHPIAGRSSDLVGALRSIDVFTAHRDAALVGLIADADVRAAAELATRVVVSSAIDPLGLDPIANLPIGGRENLRRSLSAAGDVTFAGVHGPLLDQLRDLNDRAEANRPMASAADRPVEPGYVVKGSSALAEKPAALLSPPAPAELTVSKTGEVDVSRETAMRFGLVEGVTTAVQERDGVRLISLAVDDDDVPISRWAIASSARGASCVLTLMGHGDRVEAELPEEFVASHLELRTHPAPPWPGAAFSILSSAVAYGQRALALQQRGEAVLSASKWIDCACAWFTLGVVDRAGLACQMLNLLDRDLTPDDVALRLGLSEEGGEVAARLIRMSADQVPTGRLALREPSLWIFGTYTEDLRR